MSDILTPFPDLEATLISWLPGVLVTGGSVRAGLSFGPADETALKADDGVFVRVGSIVAPDDMITKVSTVHFDFFAASRTVGYAVAGQVGGLLYSTRKVAGVVIDQVTVSGPTEAPWDNSNIRRFLVVTRISTRR